MILPDEGRDNVEKSHAPSRKNAPWTPKELIESLEKWHPDQPIDIGVEYRGIGHVEVILHQNGNTILLTEGRS